MKITEASIEINRKKGKLFSISVEMPIWDKLSNDDFISINMPLFGIKTFAQNELDAEKAIDEALRVFCMNAEKFGKGLEIELKLIGWSFTEQSENFTLMSYNVKNNNTVIGQIMQTGEQVVQKLELAC